MTENTDHFWLQQWLFYSLKLQLKQPESCLWQLNQLSQSQPAAPLIVAISGAQGSGKTTLAVALQQLWLRFGVQADILSLDDYYLTAEQRLAQAQQWHPLFAERGVPGTHDTRLLLMQLEQFRQGQAQSWRRYDKGSDSPGLAATPTAARLLILEGWCVGLKAQPEHELQQPLNELELQQDPDASWRRQVNQQLQLCYQQIWQLCDSLIWLKAPDWPAVCRWRQWQERALQQQGLGKNSAQLQRFMLYFQRLTEQSWLQLPACANFILTLDQQHNFIGLTPGEQADGPKRPADFPPIA